MKILNRFMYKYGVMLMNTLLTAIGILIWYIWIDNKAIETLRYNEQKEINIALKDFNIFINDRVYNTEKKLVLIEQKNNFQDEKIELLTKK